MKFENTCENELPSFNSLKQIKKKFVSNQICAYNSDKKIVKIKYLVVTDICRFLLKKTDIRHVEHWFDSGFDYSSLFWDFLVLKMRKSGLETAQNGQIKPILALFLQDFLVAAVWYNK